MLIIISRYVGRDRLYDYLRKKNADDHPTRRQVMDWLKTQKVWQLHAKPQKRKSTKPVIVSKPLKYFQVDLTGPLNRDRGYNYIIGLIDVNTKMLFTEALRNKTSQDVANAMEGIIRNNRLDISVIQSDNGAEFLGHEFQALLRNYRIKHTTSKPSSPWTNGQIERVWGTIKQMLYRYQTASDSNNWVSILPILTKNYNQTVHRSVGASPIEALNRITTETETLQEIIHKPSKFAVGNSVRLRLRIDNPLEKAKQYYSDQVYTIINVFMANKNALERYKVADSSGNKTKGIFNETDLLKVEEIREPPDINRQVRTNRNTRSPRITHIRQRELDELNRIARPRNPTRRY